MPSVSALTITPPDVQCGDLIEMRVTVTFAGPPKEVRVVFEIEPPCTFSQQTQKVLMSRDGPSPQDFRLVESVRCPSGNVFRPRIRATATDPGGSSRSVSHVRVAC